MCLPAAATCIAHAPPFVRCTAQQILTGKAHLPKSKCDKGAIWTTKKMRNACYPVVYLNVYVCVVCPHISCTKCGPVVGPTSGPIYHHASPLVGGGHV